MKKNVFLYVYICLQITVPKEVFFGQENKVCAVQILKNPKSSSMCGTLLSYFVGLLLKEPI